MLEISGLCSAYGRIEVLSGVNLSVARGEIVSLIGANGAGKTTLLRAISGVQPITAGTISFAGKPIEAAPPHRRVLAGIAHVPQGRPGVQTTSGAGKPRPGAVFRSDRGLAGDLASV